MPALGKAFACLALLGAQTWAAPCNTASTCNQDTTSLLQVSSAMKFGSEREESTAPLEVEEAALTPPSYKKPEVATAGKQLRVSWKLPAISSPVLSTAVQVRAVGDTDWHFVDTSGDQNVLVASGGSSVSAPASSILISIPDTSKTYQARVSMKNSEGWGDYSPTSASAAFEAEPVPDVELEEEAPAVRTEELISEADDLTEESIDASADAAKATAENAVQMRSGAMQAQAKNAAAQKEVAAKQAAVKSVIWEAYQSKKSSSAAVAAAAKADALAEKLTTAATKAEAKKAAAEMMLTAAEELAAKTAAELKAAKQETGDWNANQKKAAKQNAAKKYDVQLSDQAHTAAEKTATKKLIEKYAAQVKKGASTIESKHYEAQQENMKPPQPQLYTPSEIEEMTKISAQIPW